MKYDFDKIIDRTNTYSVKYDFSGRGFRGDTIPMWVADMDFETAPEVVAAIKKRAEHGIFGYTMPNAEFYKPIVDWYSARHNWSPDPTRFFTVPGVVFAVCTLLRAVTAAGDAVIICEPVYYPFKSSIINNDRKPIVSELKFDGGRYTIDFDDFEKKIIENKVKAFILCSPHNPVGRVWTVGELERLGEICLRHGVFVISDEIHADFTFSGKHVVFPTVKKEFEDVSAVCTSPSKSFNLAGLQTANVYMPNPEVYRRFCDELDKIGYWEPNPLGLVGCSAAYSKGGDWFDALIKYLAENLRFAREYLRENIPEITLIEPEGTYLLWLDCKGLGLNDEELKRLFEEKAGVWLDAGTMFGAGGSGFMRVNIACPKAILKTALERLASAVSEL